MLYSLLLFLFFNNFIRLFCFTCIISWRLTTFNNCVILSEKHLAVLIFITWSYPRLTQHWLNSNLWTRGFLWILHFLWDISKSLVFFCLIFLPFLFRFLYLSHLFQNRFSLVVNNIHCFCSWLFILLFSRRIRSLLWIIWFFLLVWHLMSDILNIIRILDHNNSWFLVSGCSTFSKFNRLILFDFW